MGARTTTADVIEQLRQGVATLTSTDQWAQWLRVQRRFHHYSWANSLLILMQRPDATRVAGYHTWKSVGRQVRKTERGIAILAPVIRRLRAEDEAEDKTDRVLVGHPAAFRLAWVFDIAQTDGEALPEVVSRLTGDAGGSRFAELVQVAATLGYSVEVSELPGERNGDCTFELKRIRVREGLEPAQSVKTLAHELAHAILHGEADCSSLARSAAELEAESVAFVVCDDLGLDSSAYSFGYIATWAGCGDEADKAISRSAQRINKTARSILELLDHGSG
ncbi:MAG: ArdC-like ssDNA-binding domain-containing protein [Candidatus Dormibacteraeota bacterium]|nr:ArdC-like ssDNA-binding domain-containing protein [Candidatus Dormibacteraeota bacterium]